MRKIFRQGALLLLLAALVCALAAHALAAGELPFDDVGKGDWFHDAVQYVYESSIMSGTSENRFSPKTNTTRGMIVTILYRMEGSPSAGKASFTDVGAGKYYADAVSWANENNVVSGYGNGRFGPDDPITREQMAAILYRYSAVKGYDTSARGSIDGFADKGHISAYAVDAMRWAVGEGLISGVGSDRLDPAGKALRCQVAAILTRFCSTNPQNGLLNVRFDSKGGSSVPAQSVERGKAASDPGTPSRAGYTFVGWFQEDAGTPFNFRTPIEKSLVLTAQWAEKSNGANTVYAYDEAHVAEENGLRFIDNAILAITKPGLSSGEKTKLAASIGGTVVGSLTEVSDVLQIRVPVSSYDGLKSLAEQAEKNDAVYCAFPDTINDAVESASHAYKDTDPWRKTMFGLKNDWWATAINAQSAWAAFGEMRSAIPISVGVVDGGFDLPHEDLNARFPTSDYEAANYIDYIDDGNDHGTAVAGLIGAENNNKGMCGVAYGAPLVCVDRTPANMNHDGEVGFRTIDYMWAFDEILKAGARVINFSVGFSHRSESGFQKMKAEHPEWTWTSADEYNAYVTQAALELGRTYASYLGSVIRKGWDPLFVQAAGNGIDNGSSGIAAIWVGWFGSITQEIADTAAANYGMPGSELLSHILVVGATGSKKDKDGNYIMTQYSNFGRTVNICAPGGSESEGVLTTSLSNGYTSSFWGTSAAAPIVSGAAAFIWSINPSLTAPEVRELLLNNYSVRAVGDAAAKGSYPMLDLYKAAEAAVKTLRNNTVILSGHVVNEQGDDLDGVRVTILSMDGRIAYGSGSTDGSGMFRISSELQKIMVVLEKKGYITIRGRVDLSTFAGKLPADAVLNFEINSNREGDIVMYRDSSEQQALTGVVIDLDTNKPVAGVAVSFFSEMHPEECETVITDKDGRFTFRNKTIANDWWSLSVEDDQYEYDRNVNVTAEGYATTEGFCGYLYVKKK